jgi:outer membrane protein OmpA-like peptidoglycan-associated protein
MSLLKVRATALTVTLCLASTIMIASANSSGASAPRLSTPSCTETFNGSVNDTWNTADNWSPASVPGSTDVACMSGYTVTVGSGTNSVGAVEGGTLIVDSSLALIDASTANELDGLTLESNFTGLASSTLAVDGDMTWGAGTTGAQINVSSGGLAITQPSGYAFDVNGTGQVYDEGGSVTTSSPITINDLSLIGADGPTISTTSTATFASGTYEANGGLGVAISAAGLVMGGTTDLSNFGVTATGTTSSLTGTAATFSAVNFSVATGATLSVPSGDTVVSFGNGSEIDGTLEGDGTLIEQANDVVGGTVTVSTFSETSGTTTLQSGNSFDPGTCDIDATMEFQANGSCGTVNLEAGYLNVDVAAATFNVTGEFTWTNSGQINDAPEGRLTISQSAGSSFNFAGSGQEYLIGDIISTASPINLGNGGFIDTGGNYGQAEVTTTSTLSIGNGVLISANGGNGAVFSAAGLAAHADTAPYGFASDSLTLTGGSTTIASGATLDTGPFSVTGGTVDVNGTIDTQGNNASESGGTLAGTGTVDGALNQTGGTLKPGLADAGALSLSGGYTQSGGSLAIALNSSSSYTNLAVDGRVGVNGTVAVTTDDDSPALGTTFDVITGATSFATSSPAITPTGAYVGSTSAPDFVLTAEHVSGVPTEVTAIAGNAQAAVTWVAPASDGGGTVASYTVTAKDLTTAGNGGQTCQYTVEGPPDLTCTVIDLTNGNKYSFTVTATNPVGTSGPSTASNEVVPAAPPDAPTGVASTGGAAQATVTWTAPTSDGGAPITKYTVTAIDTTNSSNGGQTCTDTVVKGGHDTCTLKGLTNGDTYSFTVTATNDAGTSSPSDGSLAIEVDAVLVTVSPTRLVVDTQKTTVATCAISVGALTACAITVKSPNGVVMATGSATSESPVTRLPVTVTVNAKALTLADAPGGVAGAVTAAVTTSVGNVLDAGAAVQFVRATVKVTLAGDVLFSSGSAKVSAVGKKEIVALGKEIKGAKLAECDGYTDNTGTKAANLALGLARAKAVCALLKPYVKATKVKSYGEADPVATNSTPAGRAKNRRVVIKVTS